MTTRALNAWLVETGFVKREAGMWVSLTPGLSTASFGPQVSWTAVGLKETWVAALAQGKTTEPLDRLLRNLRLKFGWLPVWAVLDAAKLREAATSK
jgi:hypothetical protein